MAGPGAHPTVSLKIPVRLALRSELLPMLRLAIPVVMAELDAGFQSVREIIVEGQGVVDVRVNRRARTNRLDEATGLPCFT